MVIGRLFGRAYEWQTYPAFFINGNVTYWRLVMMLVHRVVYYVGQWTRAKAGSLPFMNTIQRIKPLKPGSRAGGKD